jgi:hypothetical protein
MSTCHRIWIEVVGLGVSGLRYRLTHNGVTLIESTKNPEFDAARALLARGIVGQLEIWRRGASSPAMRLDIEKGARLTVEEGDCEGLRFVRWRHYRSITVLMPFPAAPSAPGRAEMKGPRVP